MDAGVVDQDVEPFAVGIEKPTRKLGDRLAIQ